MSDISLSKIMTINKTMKTRQIEERERKGKGKGKEKGRENKAKRK